MKLYCILLFLLIGKFSSAQTNENVVMARASAKMPMLAYGLGEDRLGGAKMGYIDTGVVLKVIDSVKNQYLVKLAKNRNAYINKSEVRIDTSLKTRPYYLTNSWSVRGDSLYDYVSLSVDEKLPYKTWMEINPSKIMVEIYGVQSNTNWITQLTSAKEVKHIFFNQVEDDVVRVTIELKHAQHWGYTTLYKGRSLTVRIRRQPNVLRLRKMKIAVDAGHGGSNVGASGVTSKAVEKDLTLKFAHELERQLKQDGANVIMTRTSDTDFNNIDRVLWLQKEMPDLLISLHLNSSGNKNVKGVSTYYKHIGFRPLTTSILEQMLELNLNEFGNVGHFNFTLNTPTDFPNSLVEIAFLSNEEDEKKILDPKFHKDVARKISSGIKDWLKNVNH